MHLKILFLVDDREEIVFFYREITQSNHLVFKSTNDLSEAEQLLSDGIVNLVIIDALENEGSKYELVRRMKQDGQMSKIPIVVLSDLSDEEQ